MPLNKVCIYDFIQAYDTKRKSVRYSNTDSFKQSRTENMFVCDSVSQTSWGAILKTVLAWVSDRKYVNMLYIQPFSR